MARSVPFRLVYAPKVKRHLRLIDAEHYGLIRYKIQEQLEFEPDVETKNRKPLRPPALLGAGWEIRFGPGNRFRVFYDIDLAERQVLILAIGVKEGSRLTIGGEEVET